MTERQIDEAIDGAVRDLMDVDATPAFRARVLSRLEPPAGPVWWFRVAVVSAGVAAVFLALLLTREPPAGPAPAPSLAQNVPAAVAVSSPVTAERPPSGPRRQRPAVPFPRSGPVNQSGAGVPSPPRRNPTHVVAPGALVATVSDPSGGGDGIDTLAVIEPIGLTPIETVPIGVSEIVVAPLTPISVLEIAPFDARRERD